MAIQVTSEERLRFKKRARQRLLGAVVLLLAAAIILPLLLDQAPRPLNADVVINMPVPVVASSKSAGLPGPGALPARVAVPANALAAPPGKPASAQLAVAPAQLTTAVQVAQRKPAVVKTDERTPPPVTGISRLNQVLAITHQAATTVDKSAALVAAKSSHKIEDGHIRYVVQLGAFSNAENVRQLRQRLKLVGVDTYIENLHSGSVRVRAGPFDSHAQADKTLAKIAMAGIQAQIVPLSY